MARRDAERVRRDVALRIAEQRRQLGLTQEDLAVRCDVTAHWIRQVESGQANLTINTLASLADTLMIDVAALFERPRSRKAGPGRPPGSRSATRRRARAR